MSDAPRNPWNQATLRAFGEQIRQLDEQARPQPRAERRSRRGRTRVGLLVATAIAAVAVAGALTLAPGARRTNTILGRASAAAEHAGTMRFQSTVTIHVAGKTRPVLTEQGAVDFRSSSYATSTHYASSNQQLQRLRVGGLIYSSTGTQRDEPNQTVRWSSKPATSVGGNFIGETTALTFPPFSSAHSPGSASAQNESVRTRSTGGPISTWFPRTSRRS